MGCYSQILLAIEGEAKICLRDNVIGGNRERRVVNNFSFSIAKNNVFDCQN